VDLVVTSQQSASVSNTEDKIEATFAGAGTGNTHFSEVTIEMKTTKRLTYQDIAVQAKGDPFNWFSNFWLADTCQQRRCLACFTAATRPSSCPLKQLTDFHVLADPQLVDKVISDSLQTAGRVSCWVSSSRLP
jgi:hypothetical protein